MRDFNPMRFGSRLWICPSWSEAPDPQAVNLRMDPGLAFGTGTHPTTALCLEWLDANPVAGKVVIDYGCGSGVLAVAAALLGARTVYAVDNDPQALLATEENAERNGVRASIKTSAPENFSASSVDILLANILANPLLELESDFARRVRPNGVCVLSGILAEQADDITAGYQRDFEHFQTAQRDDWVRISARRKP